MRYLNYLTIYEVLKYLTIYEIIYEMLNYLSNDEHLIINEMFKLFNHLWDI